MATASGEPEYIEGPLLVDGLLEKRSYQLSLAETAATDHTLVCLPTGLGKTAVSLLVTAERLAEHGGTSLLLAPTKPLVQQHAAFYREALSVDDDDIVVFTGAVRPDDRADLWESARIVCATPQVIENDLVGNRISLADVTHVTFDECHRATGNYAYNYIADRYHADSDEPLVTGMSASPYSRFSDSPYSRFPPLGSHGPIGPWSPRGRSSRHRRRGATPTTKQPQTTANARGPVGSTASRGGV